MRVFAVGMVAVALVAAGCGGETATTDEPAFVDEPLATLEQLGNAPDCDALNTLMVGVQGQDFRDDAEVTLADEQAAGEALGPNEPVGDYDSHYQAFSDRQGDLGCSDAEMMDALDSAFEKRCWAWLTAGHDADEEPLLLNTATCLAYTGE